MHFHAAELNFGVRMFSVRLHQLQWEPRQDRFQCFQVHLEFTHAATSVYTSLIKWCCLVIIRCPSRRVIKNERGLSPEHDYLWYGIPASYWPGNAWLDSTMVKSSSSGIISSSSLDSPIAPSKQSSIPPLLSF